MIESENKKSNPVYFFDDYSAKELNENKVGRKGLSLFKLKDMDVPVPEFFVVSSDVFVDFIMKAFNGGKARILANGRNPENEEVEGVLLKEEFSKEVSDEILSAYTRLSGFTDAWVSVRSSVVFTQDKNISFSGIFSTELNVRKYDELLQSIKRIYASMFSDDVVAYAKRMNIDLAEARISVVVQKMVQSEVAGVVYTTDPITQDRTKMSIEAVYGLGDVISLGEITPDTYVLNKKDLSTAEKHISPQEWMKVRTMRKTGKGVMGIEKIKISKNWSHKQKLPDKDMQEIAKISLIIEDKGNEDKGNEAQNVEWVLSGGKFWILQNKAIRYTSLSDGIIPEGVYFVRKNVRDVILGFIEKYRSEDEMVSSAMSEAKKIVEKNNDEEIKKLERLIVEAKKEVDTKLSTPETKKDDFVISGVGASFGTATGKVRIVSSATGKKYSREEILLIQKYSSEMESMILSSGGIIMETGGLTSDTAILCREFAIPAVVGATGASSLLREGDWVKIDGNSGTIYKDEKIKGEELEVHPVVDAYTKGALSGMEGIQNSKQEEAKEDLPPKDFTLPPSATRIFSMATDTSEKLFKYVGDSHGIVYIDLDKMMLEDGRHPLQYVADKKFLDYTKKICEKILGYVNLAEGNDVILTIGSSRVRDFRSLIGGKKHENESLSPDALGALHYINNPELLTRVVRIVRRIRNVYKKRNVSLGIHSVMNEDYMVEIKKQLSGEKLKRTSSFNIYAILDNPSEIILADEIANAKIDGIILNMPRIAMQMQGFKIEDTKARYDLARHSIFKVLDNLLQEVKGKVDKVIVIVEDSKPLLRYCVRAGIFGVAVLPEEIKESRKVATDEEAKIILGK